MRQSHNFKCLANRHTVGLTFASWLSMCALFSLVNSGCLILEREKGTEEKNSPPSIISPDNAQHPLGALVRLDLPPVDPESTEEVFEFVVRDPNVEQVLQYRVFLDRVSGPVENGLIDQDELQPIGQTDRPWEFSVGREQLLAKPCRKIELIVVGEFDFPELKPVEENDIDVAVWWVVSSSAVNPAECPQ